MVLSLFVMIAIRSRRYTCIEVGLVVVFCGGAGSLSSKEWRDDSIEAKLYRGIQL